MPGGRLCAAEAAAAAARRERPAAAAAPRRGCTMTLAELPGDHRAAGRMEQAGDALEEVLSKALSQRSLTLGVYEAAKLLNVDPDNVVLCLLAADEEEEAADAALQIHFTLLQAFCCENDINILRVSNPARLAQLLLPAAGPEPPADLHCVLVTNPHASPWKDPALSQLMCFCRESRYMDQWVPVINLPER
ncbi:growth arrest and DNA damage-inducible protein GADD45 alpha [Falco peregrinus]|uniref:growth arrest and DNA damage-inducible protein GADD45 alpha n=2 Tax=Falco TaxID=8952 RepID=UPI002479E189|nr:growth arrest and DNA damage-inducible protein GADD45 alpha [Falco peregrinus]